METLVRALTLLLTLVLISPFVAEAKRPAPDLVIEKTTQTSSTFWKVKVKNVGKGHAAATTLKMVATPGGSYSCPVGAIKAGESADVPCRMPFQSKKDMRCEFILNPEKSLAEASYANNRVTAVTNPKFN